MAARLSATLLRTQTDRRLTALAAGGSEPAFEALVERYRRPLQTYCRRLLLDGASAEDVVQQAFLSTWQTLRAGRAIDDVKPWLYRVAHNGAVNALKRSGYRTEELDEALTGAGAPEEDLERRIAVRRTLAGLAALPELQRQALLRTAVEGRSHEQVARELGLSDGAVRGLVYRARSTLRAAATAATPLPVAEWIGSWGGGAGAAALVLKGSAAVVATGALAGGAVVAERDASRSDAAASPAAVHASPHRAPRGGGVPAPRPVIPADVVTARDEDTERPRGRARRRHRRGRDRDRDRDDAAVLTVDDRDDDDHSGPGRDGGDDAPEADDHSGPGGGDDGTTEDRSGSGGGGSDHVVSDDTSGPSETSGSGFSSSGSGSGDDRLGATEPMTTDSSGSGSDDVTGSSSGSGSSGPSGDEPDRTG